MANVYSTTLVDELNRLANGGATYPPVNQYLDADGAANKWSGTAGLALLGALNAKNASQGLGLNLVCNQLGSTTGLEARDALAARAS